MFRPLFRPLSNSVHQDGKAQPHLEYSHPSSTDETGRTAKVQRPKSSAALKD